MHNYTHHGIGKVWIEWDDNKVDVRLVKSPSQFIHCSVHDIEGKLYWLTTIYAHNQSDKRKKFWQDMDDICRNQQGPWCVVGDYNNVVTSLDRYGGNLVTKAEYKDLQAIIDNNGWYQMDNTREYYTWSNKQVTNPIYSRVDKILANMEWLQDHNDPTLTILPSHVSDHSMLYLSKPDEMRRKRQFRFNNCWVDTIGYYEMMQKS